MRIKMWWYHIGINSLLLAAHAVGKSGAELQDIFYHKVTEGASKNADPSIEFGKIVLYFSQQPELEETSTTQGQEKVEQFTFKSVVSLKQVAQAVKAFNQQDKTVCKAELIVKEQARTITLRITYNPEKVMLVRELFSSIKLSKGFSCTLYNKPLLDKLAKSKTTILQTASNAHKFGVVIDMGHGGEDLGAIGPHNCKEKDVTYAIGMSLASLLRKQGFDVFCTRNDDSFVPLDGRTTFANACMNADVVVSIHANSGGPLASGVETWCYNPVMITDANVIPNTNYRTYVNTMRTQRYQQSSLLAQFVQRDVIAQVKKKQATVIDRGVKEAVSQILFGTIRPTILIEVGFMSHSLEEELLASVDYQRLIARGISNGIIAYKQSI